MDYEAAISPVRHASWELYLKSPDAAKGRLVLFTTAGSDSIWDYQFGPHDRLLFGRESAGVPENLHDLADVRLRIPIRAETRSLNVVVSAGIALGEAQRQLGPRNTEL